MGALSPALPPPQRTHPLFLQVVSHLLVFTFCQFLISILVIFSEYGLNFCISVAFPESVEKVEVNLYSTWCSLSPETLGCRRKGERQHVPEKYLLPQMKTIALPVLRAETSSRQQELACTIGIPKF